MGTTKGVKLYFQLVLLREILIIAKLPPPQAGFEPSQNLKSDFVE